MRPIGYGLIAFFGSGILWVLFSVNGGIGEAVSGDIPLLPSIYFFGAIFFLSLPISIIAEIIQWRRRKKETKRYTDYLADESSV